MKHLEHGVRFQTEPTDRKAGRILVVSGTQSRNRDWDTGKPYRLLPGGMRFDAWGKTGLVLYMHNFNIPLAKGSLFLEEGKLWAPDTLDFHRRVVPVATQNWIGDAIGEIDTGVIADLWEEKYLNSVSIHIMMTQEDELNIVETAEEILIPTSEVIEFSVVTVPGDREANRERMLAMGLDGALAECLLCEVEQQGGHVSGDKPFILSGGGLLPVNAHVGDMGKTSSLKFIPKPEVREMDPKEQDVDVADDADVEPVEPVESVDTPADDEVGTEIHGEVLETEIDETVDIPIEEIAEEVVLVLAEDPEALMALARAFAGNPEVIATFVEALRENAEEILLPQVLAIPKQPKYRFIRSKAADIPAKQVAEQVKQTSEKRRPLRRRVALGMYRKSN